MFDSSITSINFSTPRQLVNPLTRQLITAFTILSFP
jgi:hypothetical protein